MSVSTLLDADDVTLVEALESANIATLVPVLVQLSGDPSPLRGEVRPVPGVIGDVRGAIPDAFQAEIRALALEVLKAYRDEKRALPAPPSDEMLLEMLCWCVGEEVAPEYLPVVLEETRLREENRAASRGSGDPGRNSSRPSTCWSSAPASVACAPRFASRRPAFPTR